MKYLHLYKYPLFTATKKNNKSRKSYIVSLSFYLRKSKSHEGHSCPHTIYLLYHLIRIHRKFIEMCIFSILKSLLMIACITGLCVF